MTEESEGKSAIIGIRHAQTKYTHEGLDLTEAGIQQTKESARALKPELDKYQILIAISSPRVRATGTAQVFLEELGKPVEMIKISHQARATDIANLDYTLWDNLKNQSPFGKNYWILDPAFQENIYDGDGKLLAEGRISVEKRALRLLKHYGNFTHKIETQTGKKVALLVFTHGEILRPLFRGLYPKTANPLDDQILPAHNEPIVIKLDSPKEGQYTFSARGIESKVTVNFKNSTYSLRE